MEVFMLVKRQKTSIFIDAKQEWTVLNVKKMLEGIVKKTPEELRLLHRDEIMEDDKKLVDLGLTDQTTKPQSPAVIGLVYKISASQTAQQIIAIEILPNTSTNSEFEELVITPVSTPPELPPQMKPQESPVAGS